MIYISRVWVLFLFTTRGDFHAFFAAISLRAEWHLRLETGVTGCKQSRTKVSRLFRPVSTSWSEKRCISSPDDRTRRPGGTSCNKVSEKLSRPEAMKQNWRRSWDEVTIEETTLTNSNLIPRAEAPRLMHEARPAPLLVLVSSFRSPVLRSRAAQDEL